MTSPLSPADQLRAASGLAAACASELEQAKLQFAAAVTPEDKLIAARRIDRAQQALAAAVQAVASCPPLVP